MRKVLFGIAAAVLLAIGMAAPASAATGSWSVSYQTASASGTAGYQSSGSTIGGTLTVNGTLSNTGSGCYLVELDLMILGTIDVYPESLDSAEVCGTGSGPVTFNVGVYGFLLNASVKVCDVDLGRTCGTSQQLTFS